MVINIRGYDVLIDNEDFDRIMEHNWYYTSNNPKRPYFSFSKRINGERHWTSLHRFILDAPKGSVVDHISGDTLDNRKSNLRITDWTGNAQNHGIADNNTSGYRGVHFDKRKKRWKAVIYHNEKGILLGHYPSKELASFVYEEAAKVIFGEYYRDVGVCIAPELSTEYIPDCKLDRNNNGYFSVIKYDGRSHYLKGYKTPEEAQLAYKELRAKIDLVKILELAQKKIRQALKDDTVNIGKIIELKASLAPPEEILYEHDCLHCGKKFSTMFPNSRYCSKVCAKVVDPEGNKGIAHICPGCGKHFKGERRQKYCNKQCYYEHGNGRKKKA
jgi:hypothetical protein